MGNGITKENQKAAQKRLEFAVPPKCKEEGATFNRAQFLRFKQLLDLYLVSLDLKVGTSARGRKLADYCDEQGYTPTELLVDNYEPDKSREEMSQSDTIVLEMAADVERVVLNDLVAIQPPEIQ